MQNKRIIAFDYGTSRIGVAISDLSNSLATGLPWIKNDESFDEKMEELWKKYSPIELILIGDPIQENARTEIMIFKDFLSEKYLSKIKLVDERFTTRIARTTFKLNGLKSSKIDKKVDSEAARIILQEYLDKQNEIKRD